MRGHEGGWHRNPSAPRCLPREACASFYLGLKALGNNSGAGSRGRKRAEGWRTPPSPALRWVGCAGGAHRDPAGCVQPLGKAAGLQPPCLQPWGSGRGLRAAPSSSCWKGIGENTGPGRGEAPHRAPCGSWAAHRGMGGFGCPPFEWPQRSHGGSPKWDGTFWGPLIPFGTRLVAAFGPLVPFGTPILVLSSLLRCRSWSLLVLSPLLG